MQKKSAPLKRLVWCFVLILAIFCLVRLYYTATDDFRLANITHSIPYQPEWSIVQPNHSEEERLNQILSQTFHYLGKGSQSYVFISNDGSYVLKFFKFKHLRPNWFYALLASGGLFKQQYAKQTARKERKLWGVFRAYKLAYDVDRQESGLVFIQLNTIGNPKRAVVISDKIGWQRTIDLQNYTFILQEKGDPLQDVLKGLLQRGDVNTAMQRLDQIFDLYAAEYAKGIYDRDHAVMRNAGFVGARPIHMDVGKLTADETLKQKSRAKEDALLIAAKIKPWITRHYEQYSVPLSAGIDQKIHRLYD